MPYSSPDARYRRAIWALLWAWAALWAALHLAHPAGSWHFFVTGARLLSAAPAAGGGLHLYASHPYLQIGPLSFIVARPFAEMAGTPGVWAAVLTMCAAGVLVLGMVADMADRDRVRDPARLLLPGAVFIPVWAELAVQSAHLDDVLALVLGVAGVWAVSRGRPVLAAVALAAAADSKPWAAGFVVVILALPRGQWVRALGVWAALVAAAWLPFVLADHGTMAAFRYQIINSQASALRALGVGTAKTPAWCRTGQVVGGIALGAVVARKAPAAIILIVVAVRLLLDPGVHLYYDAGLLTGTLLVDVLLIGTVVPWLSIAAVLTIYLPPLVTPLSIPVFHAEGAVRAAYLLSALAIVGLLALRRPSAEAGASSSGPPGQTPAAEWAYRLGMRVEVEGG